MADERSPRSIPVLAEDAQLSPLRLADRAVSPRVLAAVPPGIATRYRLLPLALEDQTLEDRKSVV